MLPTVEQVREHAEKYPTPGGGGLWMFRGDEWLLLGRTLCVEMAALRVSGEDTEVFRLGIHREIREWRPLPLIAFGPGTWTPCDQSGNPLPLIDALDGLRILYADARRELLAERATEARAQAAEERARRLWEAKEEWRKRAEKAEAALKESP